MIDQSKLQKHIEESWSLITPFWPLKNMVSTNPLFGLINHSFNDAFARSKSAISSSITDDKILMANKQTMQWCQLFFDEGQATIAMPYKKLGLYQAVIRLEHYSQADGHILDIISKLPDNAYEAVAFLVDALLLKESDRVEVFSYLLTSLSGWSSYIAYIADSRKDDFYKFIKIDYLAVRLLHAYIYNVQLKKRNLIVNTKQVEDHLQRIQASEQEYDEIFLKSIIKSVASIGTSKPGKIQFLFCIDVRSEQIRRVIENEGSYQTFGAAGFFNVPIAVHDVLLGQKFNTCPVFVKPSHTIKNQLLCNRQECAVYQEAKVSFKIIFDAIYKALKYTFTAPFALVEVLGPWSICWMFICSFFSVKSAKLKNFFSRKEAVKDCTWPAIEKDKQGHGMTLEEQAMYAKNLLQSIGLVRSEAFGSLIVLTSHVAVTTNNAVEALLNCGACGGNSGLVNAKVMASILNQVEIRKKLAQGGIVIPDHSYFIAAEHNTTTHKVLLYDSQEFKKVDVDIKQELDQLLHNVTQKLQQKSLPKAVRRSSDWSEILPEWGAAKNTALCIAPRSITQDIDLQGRVFLHSYDYKVDETGKCLDSILQGPLVVAHWINAQYLFSSLEPVLYGSGSKVTQNVIGKLGVMQGNMSDIMTGLSLQSLYKRADSLYHEPIRLRVVIQAPLSTVLKIIQKHTILHNLCKNQWIFLFCINPKDNQMYQLSQELIWQKYI